MRKALFFLGMTAVGFLSAQNGPNMDAETWEPNANGVLLPTHWTFSTDQGITKAPGHLGCDTSIRIEAEEGVEKIVEYGMLPLLPGKRYIGRAYVKNASSIVRCTVSAMYNYKGFFEAQDMEAYSFDTHIEPDWMEYGMQYIDVLIPDDQQYSIEESNYRIHMNIAYNPDGEGTDKYFYIDNILLWEYGTPNPDADLCSVLSANDAQAIAKDVQLESSVVSTELKLLAKGETEATIYDASSKKIASKKANGNLTFNVSGWPKGVYFMNIVSRGVIVQKKFIVK